MIPVHLVPQPASPEGRPALPDDPFCYLVGRDGLYKQVRNEFYDARVKVSAVPSLAEMAVEAKLKVPRLPRALLRRVEAFFTAVHERFGGEAVVLLLCDPARAEWRVEVPPQTVSAARVRYELSALPPPPEGFRRFGSIHSHAGLPAFHSSTDDADEAACDGLHLTVGNVDGPVRSYSARWILAGQEFKARLEEVLEGEAGAAPAPEWLAQVRPAVPAEERAELWPTLDESPFGAEAGGERRGAPGDPYGLPLPQEFGSPEEYEQCLLEVREELDERLREAFARQSEEDPSFGGGSYGAPS